MALQQDWRREISNRLESYRDKKRKSNGESQSALLFGSQQSEQESTGQSPQVIGRDPDETVDEPLPGPGILDDEQYEDPLQATLAAAAARMQVESSATPISETQPKPVQQLLIDVSNPPEMESESTESAEPEADEDFEAYDRQESPLFPVAGLTLRRRAGALDAICLLLAYSSILALFAGLGGRLALGRFDALVFGGIFALLYAQYFTLFTMMGGATPGMILSGLRLVSFDGSAPQPRQLMWRSLGYVVSGGTALMGFLWAFRDEDHLSWHDRISSTYITSLDSVLEESEDALSLKLK